MTVVVGLSGVGLDVAWPLRCPGAHMRVGMLQKLYETIDWSTWKSPCEDDDDDDDDDDEDDDEDEEDDE